RRSWETKDLGDVVASLCDAFAEVKKRASPDEETFPALKVEVSGGGESPVDTVRLALPDGHQQQHVAEVLRRAGIELDDYPSAGGNRRPKINLEGVVVKVIRPQDMPQQVACGNFDLAITGRDWLVDHLAQFPSSPVRELADLRIGKVRMVAVVSNGLAVNDAAGLRQLVRERGMTLRVASEYVNIADKYARDNHLSRYRVIPTWGASEAFLPEDADLLIENTETGRTIARHNLKIIDTIFESTACLIGNTETGAEGCPPVKARRMDEFIRRLRVAAGA
ncbi:MAG: ATP phosphoribosyltransferase, partial [Dehalococcoidales bacterium]|nr:ATP phosphoribosyltransferase [Dehalococcoidales bacterium]